MKPNHKEGLFSRVARYSVAHRKLIMTVWAVVVIAAAPLAIGVSGALSGAGWEAQGSDAQIVRDELRRDFPDAGAESAIVVFQQDTAISESSDTLTTLVANLQKAPGSAGAINPLDMGPEAGLLSQDGKTALIPVALYAEVDADRPESAGELMNFVSEQTFPAGTTVNVTGEWAVWHDFNTDNEKAMKKAELLSGLPTLILLFVAFGSAIAAGLPLILAVAGIAVGFAGLNLATSLTPLSVWSMNFSMMIGLAVGIDYSLFIVSRYREEREEGKNISDAMADTLSTAGKAVFLSALTVILSLAAIFVVPVMVFRAMALGMIFSVIAVSLASLTLLPAVLAVLGDKVLVERSKEDPDRSAEGRWARWIARVLWKPRHALVVGVVLMLALAAPALGMRLGMPGARVVDSGNQSRDGYEIVVENFGPGASAPLIVTAPAESAKAIVAAAQKDPNVMQVSVITESTDSGRVAIRISPKTAGDSSETSDLVGRLRDKLSTIDSTILVGGPASQNHDLTDVLMDKALLVVGLIMSVAFLLLLIVFRSLIIAAFSVLLNLLSVAASFGFATLVFQHGIGAGLVGIEHQGFVDAWTPLFFFSLLFGLSMDYQLFLLAAIKERHQQTNDAQLSVRDGIARTGRPITNAALIMIVVFVSFGVTGPIPPTELGITLALTVLLDATIVRMMLVPSIMGILDQRAWWIPKWLDKVLPTVNFSH